MTALYILGAILVALVAGVMVAPLFQDEGPTVEMESLPPEERREAALEAVRDLRFEHETGKMGDDEYRRLRAHYGRMVLEAEEQMEAAGETVSGGGDARAAVAEARREEAGGDDAPAASTCPECDEGLEAAARFCPRCGTRQPGASGGGRDG